MARLGTGVYQDPETGELKKKVEVSLTGGADAVQQALAAKQAADAEAEAEELTLTSAASYTQSVKRRQAAMEAAKVPAAPPGGKPVDPQKMRQLASHLGRVQGTMKAPEYPPAPGTAERGDLPAPPAPPQLPPEQLPDKKALKGVGAGYAYNQAMAQGKIKQPMTLAQANKMEEETKTAPEVRVSPTPQAQRIITEMNQPTPQAPQGIAPSAGVPQQAPQQQAPQQQLEPPSSDDKKEEVEEAEDQIAASSEVQDLFGSRYEELDEVRKILMDPERRKSIEGRLTELDISDLILGREIVQEIVIVPEKFTLTLRTLREHENMFCLEKMYGVVGSGAYIEELLSVYKMTCALAAVNGGPLPDHREAVGDAGEKVSEERFAHKVSILQGMATPIIAEIGVQYDWFIVRVNQLFSWKQLKNG